MKSLNRKHLAAAVLLATSSATAVAQTSSSIRGVVTGPNGQPAQASVMIIHTPSGSVSEVETNENGRFTAKGLRVGGPYRIIVDSDVYADDIEENVFLQLGKAFKFESQLSSELAIEEVAVIGTAMSLERNAGNSSVFGLETIEKAPNVSRDISSYVRMNPLVNVSGGEISIAGNNNKFNSFTVDGVGQNDDFGLSSTGYPTLRSPISMEAIEQVSVEVSPYNVRASGFSGGLINAVTKSGTNEFHGSIFREEMTDSMSGGKDPNGEDLEIAAFKDEIFGASLGGPIIKDKLFFFAAYENWEGPSTNNWFPGGSGGLDSNISQAEFERIERASETIYNVSPQGFGGEAGNTDEKVLVKLDWNINDDHRADITYQSTEGSQVRNSTRNDRTLRDMSNWFNQDQSMESLSVGLYSTWSDSLSTEFRLSKKDNEIRPTTNTRDFGHIQIEDADGNAYHMGAERFRHTNYLENSTLSTEFLAEYLTGDHAITAGISYKNVDVFNVFVNDSLGYWTFEGDDDYSGIERFTGVADDGSVIERQASSFSYRNAITNNAADGGANLSIGNIALYAQDKFAITPDFELTYGLRYERIINGDSPTLNTSYQANYGFANTENLDGADIFLPRVGFEWQANDDVTITGGVGRYSGGQPNVWISNAYSNDGTTVVGTREFDIANPTLAITDQDRQAIAAQAGDANGDTNSIDPNFKLPSDWRASLGFEVALPIEATFNFGLQHTIKENAPHWENLEATQPTRTLADGRQAYNTRGDGDLMLTNADENGESTIITTSLSKFWDNGWSASASYTTQDVREGNSGTSSRAISNYRFNPSIDLGTPLIGTSDFEIKHRFVATLGYTAEYFDGFASSFNFFFERKSGRPFSYTMDRDRGADRVLEHGDRGYYLPYIPASASDDSIVANAAEVWEGLTELGLDRYAGGYVPKNSARDPWRTALDFAFQQEIPNPFFDGHKGTLSLTMENVLSFLDDKGIWKNDTYLQEGRAFPNAQVVRYSVEEDGRYNYSLNPSQADTRLLLDNNSVDLSSWRVKLGLRYSF